MEKCVEKFPMSGEFFSQFTIGAYFKLAISQN